MVSAHGVHSDDPSRGHGVKRGLLVILIGDDLAPAVIAVSGHVMATVQLTGRWLNGQRGAAKGIVRPAHATL